MINNSGKHSRFITAAFFRTEGPIDKGYFHNDWLVFLRYTFGMANVAACGFNFNNSLGVHVVRLHFKDCS
jgi:hypothetical protein